jgi:hypothetical protein
MTAPRGFRVREWVRRDPRLERDSVRGREAAFGDPLVLLAAQKARGEPGVEPRRVCGPSRLRFSEGTVGLGARSRGFGQLERGLGAPLRRRVPRPSGGEGDDGEQHSLGDRDQPGATIGFAVLLAVLGVLADLLANLGCR